jgi:hypothetical protein
VAATRQDSGCNATASSGTTWVHGAGIRPRHGV